jgi:hypothetical protein
MESKYLQVKNILGVQYVGVSKIWAKNVDCKLGSNWPPNYILIERS